LLHMMVRLTCDNTRIRQTPQTVEMIQTAKPSELKGNKEREKQRRDDDDVRQMMRKVSERDKSMTQ
jgi:hypothetical protein